MHECNAMQLLKTREKKHKNQRTKNNGHKAKTMKHKDHKKPSQIRDTKSHQLLDEELPFCFDEGLNSCSAC